MKKILFLALLCLLAVQGFAQPQAIGLTLNVTSGPSVDFTVRGSAPNGIADMQELELSFGSPNGAYTCTPMLYQNNSAVLLNDAADNWTGWFAPGSGGSTENSQCKLSNVTKQIISSTELWFSGHLEFKPAFNGVHAANIWAANASWVSGRAWWNIANFTVSGATSPPTITSLSPTTSGSNPTTYSITATDVSGANDISYISGSVGGHWLPYGCTWVVYRTGGKLLMNDAGNGWVTSVPFKNSQCEIAGDSFTTNGNNGTANITVTALPGFTGAKAISGQVVNIANQYTVSANLGTWTIPMNNTIGDSSGVHVLTDIPDTVNEGFNGGTMLTPTMTRPLPHNRLTTVSGNRVVKIGEPLSMHISGVPGATQVWIYERCMEDPNAIASYCMGGYVGMTSPDGIFNWDTIVSGGNGNWLGGHVYTVYVVNWGGPSTGAIPESGNIGPAAVWITDASGNPANPAMAALVNP